MNQANQNRNYQKELDQILQLQEEEGIVPTLLLHSCCAPCSSYCLEYLSEHFRITDYYYNPNITEEAEYQHRVSEMERLVREQPHKYPVDFVNGPYEPERFREAAKGYELCPEGGERCRRCFLLRLKQSCEYAAAHGFDFVTTSLTISPLKDEKVLNEIGEACAKEAGVRWLPSNFKKKGGYQRSTVLSKKYDLYRQDYCGCVFSKRRDYVKLKGNTR